MVKVGILGGTFNPIHWGHLLAAETALTHASLDRIVWIPTSHSPHKQIARPVSFHHRVEMVSLAIASHPQFVLPPFVLADVSAASPYAIDTLRKLQQHYGTCEWFWVLGLDAFRSLPRWVGRQELIPQCTWLVLPRWNFHLKRQPDLNRQPDAVQFCDGNAAVLADRFPPLDLPPEFPPDFTLDFTPEPSHLTQSCCQAVAHQLRAEAIAIQWQLLSMPLVQVSSSLVRQLCQQQRSIRYLVPEAVREYIMTYHLYGEPIA